jgi:hypothetical protein
MGMPTPIHHSTVNCDGGQPAAVRYRSQMEITDKGHECKHHSKIDAQGCQVNKSDPDQKEVDEPLRPPTAREFMNRSDHHLQGS